MQLCKLSQAVENKFGFVTCSPRLVFHTDPLHQLVKRGKKAGEITQIKTFFHTHQGVFRWNEFGRGVLNHHSLLKQ
jgi:hypothetical protein